MPVAIVAFAVQYGFFFTLTVFRNYILLPTILMFFTTMSLIIVVKVGLQAHSNAGSRIAWAGLFTLGEYICLLVSDYQQFAKFYH